MKPKYEISFELFKAVNYGMTDEEITFCYPNLKYGSIVNIVYFKCFDYIRSMGFCISIEDYQTYYKALLKNFDNQVESHPEFKDEDIKNIIFKMADYVLKIS